MNIVVSPAKKLDFESSVNFEESTPALLTQTTKLAKSLKNCSKSDIQQLMKLSDDLSELNFNRYQNFSKTKSIKPAVFAFIGDTYKGLKAEEFNEDEIRYAQAHLHILSGLYGVLRPLDSIKPYRLEMGTRYKFASYKNLYDFWGNQITEVINDYANQAGSKYLVNLASEEYFKSVKVDLLNPKLINIKFLEKKGDTYKVIGLMSKRARGMMAAYIIKNKIKTPQKLKSFDVDGYKFDEKESSNNLFVFKR